MFEITSSSQVNLFVAFGAGFITFFASCLLPLVPSYLAYLSGIALGVEKTENQRWRLVKAASFFVFGLVTAFVGLGVSIRFLTTFIRDHQDWIRIITGIFFLILGLFVLGIFKHQFFSQERKLNVGGLLSKSVFVHAFLFGLAFGFGWSPCIGPVLAVILYWAAQSQTQMYGLLLLIVFGLGLGVPFVLIAAGFEKIVPLLKRYRKVSLYVEKISGVLIILFGLMLLTADFVPTISVIHRFIPSFR